ncbi:hypothetical protein QUC31_006765 [Theobroma cacao]
MNTVQDWPEPIIRVQSLSESGLPIIPERYIKPAPDRPSFIDPEDCDANIPIIDLTGLSGDEACNLPATTLDLISLACREWGFFQVVNHGVSPVLMDQARETWRSFFHLPMEIKQAYANSPKTYEGYGSRLGIEKGAILDWSDYYFLHYLPLTLKDYKKWPTSPDSCREVIDEYGKEVVKLCGRIMKVLSMNLGLREDHLQNEFGGENFGACLRVLSNANYKSVEHRVIVNSAMERVSLAFFYNPKSDIPIKPVEELVSADNPALYSPMTFDEYRLFIRLRGPKGKSQVESLKSPR